MNKVVFGDHALYQLQERKLTEDEVVDAIKAPNKIETQTNLRLKFIKLLPSPQKKYLLIVVCEKINSGLKVITVFKTSKVKKYL